MYPLGGQIVFLAKSGMRDTRRQKSDQWQIHAKFRCVLARVNSRMLPYQVLQIRVSISSETAIISSSEVRQE
jgi:hypothetical protein